MHALTTLLSTGILLFSLAARAEVDLEDVKKAISGDPVANARTTQLTKPVLEAALSKVLSTTWLFRSVTNLIDDSVVRFSTLLGALAPESNVTLNKFQAPDALSVKDPPRLHTRDSAGTLEIWIASDKTFHFDDDGLLTGRVRWGSDPPVYVLFSRGVDSTSLAFVRMPIVVTDFMKNLSEGKRMVVEMPVDEKNKLVAVFTPPAGNPFTKPAGIPLSPNIR